MRIFELFLTHPCLLSNSNRVECNQEVFLSTIQPSASKISIRYLFLFDLELTYVIRIKIHYLIFQSINYTKKRKGANFN